MKTLNRFAIALFSILFVTSCVQKPQLVKVKFAVDMTKETDVTEVGIIGQFEPLSWSETVSMLDEDRDGIYEAELTCKIYYKYMEFKFVKNGNIIELDGQGNRTIIVNDESDQEYRAIFDTKPADSTTDR
ncbi:MAG: hypothetical protein AAGC47_05055 [Bacteroidota bacterium]